jgi:glutaredoxin
MLKGINQRVLLWFLLASLPFIWTSTYASEIINQEGICTQDAESSTGCDDVLKNPNNIIISPNSEKKTSETTLKSKAETSLENKKGVAKNDIKKASTEIRKFVLYFFWGKGCPHCAKEKVFLDEMKKKYPGMQIKDYEVWYNKQNAILLSRMAETYKIKASGVPVIFIGENAFVGFSEPSKEEIGESIRKCSVNKCINPIDKVNPLISETTPVDKDSGTTFYGEKSKEIEDYECIKKSNIVNIPLIGKVDTSEMSLPFMTLVIAGLDSFNPCAFFVLFSLLGLLVYAQSRKKMLIIGSVFVFFSGFIYFLFMSAWLNLFLLMGQVSTITKVAGVVSLIIATINIKDFFVFKKGISLTIPDSAKPKLFDRMRKLMKSTSLFSILAGTAVLAVAANSYELLCTAGFPMVFARILTLNNLSMSSYYMYLIFYNLIYVIPLSIIVIAFTVTLGRKKLTEWQGRVLKLVSGTMMLGLGLVLLLNPSLLNNMLISLLLLLVAIAFSVIVAFFTRKFGYSAG